MVWRLALVILVVAGVAGAPGGASANGRPPGTSSITFRQGQDREIAVGLTFGLVVSHDGGRTWAWMCEAALGYTGTYDPHYVFSSSGALFATTFDGVKVERDRCTFNAMPTGQTFTSTNALGPDGAIYVAASQTQDAIKMLPKDFQIYRSTNDGASFTRSKPGDAADVNDWWQTLRIAPSNPLRVYATGYSYAPPVAGGESTRTHLVFRSDDGGAIWKPMSIANLTLMPNSVIEIVGIANDSADHIYARVKLVDNTISDSIYRSLDAGATWQLIDHKAGSISSFVVRAAVNSNGKHDLIVGSQTLGAELSHDDGDTWTALVNPPHMGCLVENAAGELWACTQNYGDTSVASDKAGVMKTTDLMTWTPMLRYQDLTEAVSCAAGTPQKDMCAASWCTVCDQLGCKPSPSYGCPGAVEAPARPASGGCCDAGGAGGAGALALALSVGTVMLRPRRRRATP